MPWWGVVVGVGASPQASNGRSEPDYRTRHPGNIRSWVRLGQEAIGTICTKFSVYPLWGPPAPIAEVYVVNLGCSLTPCAAGGHSRRWQRPLAALAAGEQQLGARIHLDAVRCESRLHLNC